MIFKEIQPTIWDRLKRAKTNDRIGSAYLFSGRRGCGKEWVAIEFSKLVNCERTGENACNECSSCIKFESLQHTNLKLIVPLPGSDKSTQSINPLDALKREELVYLTDAIAEKGKNPLSKIKVPRARRITINAIRDLRKTIFLKSQSSGRKMVLIFDAHLLSEGVGESANALLKILEEPPDNTTLILVSDKKSALLPTIISRCQSVNFPPLTLDTTRKILEQDGIENEVATQLAVMAGGDIYLAKELSKQSAQNIVAEAKALAQLMTRVDAKGWREFITNNAMLAARKPDEFKFKLYLLQFWFYHAYELRSGTLVKDNLNGMVQSLKIFNETYPNANLAAINKILEETVESLVRNLYTPLTLTNLLISVQELLKGNSPQSTL